ncbi:MAG: HlyD family efflux transporter periplasmic adaptor subunit [Pirellulales bacterium]|nr:HlyD family efflux transporter periplasmic adaptor subunit [Pirellulales bacterium]
MNRRDDSRRSADDRALPVRTRGDLQMAEVAFAGNPAYVVKDPISNETFHFTAEEHALVERLRRPASLRDLARLVETQFQPRHATAWQLQQFVNRLYCDGLVLGENPGQGGELLARGRRQRRWRRATAALQLLCIRVARFDAGPTVERLYALLGPLCSPAAALVAVALICFAVLVSIGQSAELAQRLPTIAELADARMWPVWAAAVACVKVLHELGHALVCRHWGARPHEFGVLLLAGMPAIYCDVSDAWRLPSKWQRMAVSGAGMFVELIVASLAALVWRYAAPGALSTVCVSLIVVCSVGTLLVNANPLLRYDGYYLLCDWWETPNLAGRADGLLTQACRRWLLGEPATADPLLSPSKRRFLWAYAIGAKVYLALVILGALMLMLKLARPLHLQNAVYALGGITMVAVLVRPLRAAAELAINPSLQSRFRWRRLMLAGGALAAALVAICAMPVKRRVEAPLTIVAADSFPLFATSAGELESIAAAGTEVQAGEVVARLRNEEVELALMELQGLVRQQRTRVEQLRTLQATAPSAMQLLPAAEAELAAAERQLSEQKSIVAALTIRAPAAGRVLPAAARLAAQNDVDTLPTWGGTPLEARNRGAWIEAGTPLAAVVRPAGLAAWAAVGQADAPLVEPGQQVRLVAEQAPTEIYRGRVVDVARRARSNQSEYGWGSRAKQSPQSEGRYHVVRIELAATGTGLLVGARGTAKIDTLDTTVGELLLDRARRTFQRMF